MGKPMLLFQKQIYKGFTVNDTQVNLNRTHSSATTSEIVKRKQSSRQRFYSESTALRRGSSVKMNTAGSNLSRNSSFCRQNSRSRGLTPKNICSTCNKSFLPSRSW